jgi:photosystem II stability/assembly factor-like uncharacterized protein
MATRGSTRAKGWDILVATRKGAFVVRGGPSRRTWSVEGPHFLGHETNHLAADPRDPKSWLLAAKTGHLGPTVFRSIDEGRHWQEASRPPAFPKAPEGEPGPAVDRIFCLAPGHASQPGVWWAGTVPHALFRSADGGASWELVAGFSNYLASLRAKGPVFFPTPGGLITHSILIDPRDPAHVYVSLSTGGCFESGDAGGSWRPLNQGVSADFLPDPHPEVGQDPHCMVLSPSPDRLYQQNHCGVYRLDRPGQTWERIGTTLPTEVGDIGFPVVAHPRDPDTLWVFPMDASTVWPRTSPGGRPAAFCSRDGGRSWRRQAKGFPEGQAWTTVLRQAMRCDIADPVGLYVGTTAGQIWGSRDEGESWRPIASHLPQVLAIEVAGR